jgi:putative transposase
MSRKYLLKGNEVRDIFEAILPDAEIKDLVEECRFQERQRKLQAVHFVRSMVISAATGYGGRQADVMRLYFDGGAPRVARGGFYSWFNERLEATMTALANRALQFARDQPKDLPPLLARYAPDWHIVDSSTVKLDDALADEYPGTGEYAALKVHKRFSIGVGTAVDYHLSPAREHDAPHLELDESWRGLGLLVDLGYASLKLISECEAYEVSFVMRLKEGWKPKVEHVARGEVTGLFLRGTDLDALLKRETIVLGGRVVDADVTIGSGSRAVQCRLVGVPTPKGTYRFYLTNLPPEVGPHQIADIYRVRWEIEVDNKLDKSCNHLDEARSATGPAVRALVHASMISSMLACLIAHKHRLKEGRPRRRGQERTRPPIHPQSLARAMGSAALKIAAALDLEGGNAEHHWQEIAEVLEHLGQDPNWRRSPSILDQMRGWKTTPGRPRSSRLASPTRRRAN